MSQQPPGAHAADPGPSKARAGYILLVDDEEPSVEVIVSLYQDGEGYEVLTARTSQQAVELAPPEAPAFILLDVNLREESPADAVATLRAHPALARAPLVLFSGDARTSDLMAQLGAVEWLRKPYEMADAVELAERLGAVRRYPPRF
ncbi:MAG TPA: response regulator [Ktedonobacterales bacterium]|nr:response regulator [Ktedonobacterales bacterium]